MSTPTSVLAPTQSPPATRIELRSRFFLFASVVLLVIVLIGFGRTLYLRAFFDVTPIPFYLYVHGSVLTLWFLLVLIQTVLVETRRTDIHRKLGVGGAVLAVAVLAASLFTVLSVPRRFQSLGDNIETDFYVAGLVWIDLFALAAFAVFIASAICWRRRPEVHKRLMLLASISIVGPAVGRIGQFALLGSPGPSFNLIVLIAMPVALLTHDLFSTRRPHVVTLFGLAVYLATLFVPLAVAGTEFGHALIMALTPHG